MRRERAEINRSTVLLLALACLPAGGAMAEDPPPSTPAAVSVRPVPSLALGVLHGASQARVSDADLPGDAVRRTIKKEIEGRGRSVSIIGAVSSMTVRPSSDDRIRVEAQLGFWSNVDEWMAKVKGEFDVEVSETTGNVEIRIEIPELQGRKRNVRVHYNTELEVTVPAATPLDVTNKFGSVDVAGIRGPAKIRNNSGEIRLSDAVGDADLQGRFGAMYVHGVEGDLRADNSSGVLEVRAVNGRAILTNEFGNLVLEDVGGDVQARLKSGGAKAHDLRGDVDLQASFGGVEIERVQGRLIAVVQSGDLAARDVGLGADLEASYGTVVAKGIGGELSVRTKTGAIRVADVRGGLTAEGSFGDAEARGIGGPANVSVESGSVTLSDVRGDAEIGCTFGTARAVNVQGSLEVVAQSSPVNGERIAGGVHVETSFGGVTLDGVGGSVSVHNQSGGVTVKGLSGAALSGTHRIDTSFGDIRFVWPEGAGASFHLESSFGGIRTDIPIQVRESGSRRSADGTTGDGRASVTLSAESGGVIVDQD